MNLNRSNVRRWVCSLQRMVRRRFIQSLPPASALAPRLARNLLAMIPEERVPLLRRPPSLIEGQKNAPQWVQTYAQRVIVESARTRLPATVPPPRSSARIASSIRRRLPPMRRLVVRLALEHARLCEAQSQAGSQSIRQARHSFKSPNDLSSAAARKGQPERKGNAR